MNTTEQQFLLDLFVQLSENPGARVVDVISTEEMRDAIMILVPRKIEPEPAPPPPEQVRIPEPARSRIIEVVTKYHTDPAYKHTKEFMEHAVWFANTIESVDMYQVDLNSIVTHELG